MSETAVAENKPKLQLVDIDSFLSSAPAVGDAFEIDSTYDAFERIPPAKDAIYVATVTLAKDEDRRLKTGIVGSGDNKGKPYWILGFDVTLNGFNDANVPDTELAGRLRTFREDSTSFLKLTDTGRFANGLTTILTCAGIPLPSPLTEQAVVQEFIKAARNGFKVLAETKWFGSVQTGKQLKSKAGTPYDEYKVVFRGMDAFPKDPDGRPIPTAEYVDNRGRHEVFAQARIVRYYPIN